MKTRLLPTLALLVLVVAGGTAGYVIVEGWSLWDALYMTVTTVATVGYREVHPLSPAGQAFTLLLIVVGVSTALYAFSALAAVVVEGGWPKYLEHWRYVRMINHLSRPLRCLRVRTNRVDRRQRVQTPEDAVRHRRSQS